MSRRLPILVFGFCLVTGTASAQLSEDFTLPRPAGCCLAGSAMTLAEQLQDWNQLGRYYEANKALMAQPVDPNRVVFMGDSITDGWRLDTSFPASLT